MDIVRLSIRNLLVSRWFQRLLRWTLGGLFVYAGLLKLGDPAAFAIRIEKFGLLPQHWLDPLAYALPVAEIVVGMAAMLGVRGGAEGIAILLLGFMAILGHAWWSGLDVPCGCFSSEDVQRRYSLQMALLRDLVMLLGAGWLLVRRRALRS